MPRILVTDGEQRSALAIVRSLGRAGHTMFVCSTTSRPLAGASRHCRAAHRVTDPVTDPQRFGRDIRSVVGQHQIDLVIPVTDVSALPVLAVRDELERTKVVFPDEGTYSSISDKRALLEAARGLGVAVPEQRVLEEPGFSREAMEKWADGLDFDLVIKPSRSAVAGAGKFGVSIVRSRAELTTALEEYPAAAYPLLLQQRIRGAGLGAFMLTRGGEPVASFAHRRLREKPPTGGVSVYRESVALRDDVREAAEAILRHYSWTGVAMVEFKEDERTGRPYLMEVNGRFWGSLQLAIDAGVDFPDLLVRMSLGEDVESVHDYAVGVRSRWLWGDVDHLLWVIRRGAEYRTSFPDLPSALAATLQFIVPWRPGERCEVLRMTDPRPFFRESRAWFLGVLGWDREAS